MINLIEKVTLELRLQGGEVVGQTAIGVRMRVGLVKPMP